MLLNNSIVEDLWCFLLIIEKIIAGIEQIAAKGNPIINKINIIGSGCILKHGLLTHSSGGLLISPIKEKPKYKQ